ncbi:MAG: NmrA/HSCARG family protein [Burkholderiales bacterium]
MAGGKIITVFGATGAQGGGLVRAILADPAGGFAARAVTRDVNSDKARALARLGAEVVAADVDDEASMRRALEGAYGAYFVTFFWAHFSAEKELAEARSMASAAKAAGVSHVIWSSLEDVRRFVPLSDTRMPTLQGKYKVPHFDAKGEADHFFTDAGLRTTFLYASFYWENLIYFGAGPKKGPDGHYYFTAPIGTEKMAGIASEDIGKVAYGIFKAGDAYVGKTVGAAGEHLTGAEMAAAMTRAIGREIRFNNPTPDEYRAYGFPGADELGNMFQFYRDFAGPLNKVRDVARSRALNPQLLSFDAWLAQNASKIPLD